MDELVYSCIWDSEQQDLHGVGGITWGSGEGGLEAEGGALEAEGGGLGAGGVSISTIGPVFSNIPVESCKYVIYFR